MDIDQIVMKTEIQPNGDILLYYVDGNQESAGILEDQQEDIQMLSEAKYVVEDTGESESADELDLAQAKEQLACETWTDEELRRLLVFYLDNKDTFQSGTTKKKHLWAVACRTMLAGKKPLSCEYKLRSMRDTYFNINAEKLKGNNIYWTFFNLCQQAFQNENKVDSYLNITNKPIEEVKKDVQSVKKSTDSNVEKMLNLYLSLKNLYSNNAYVKGIWERIAREMNEKDVDYWYKRFLNFKQHYIKMLQKRLYSGENSVNWPYMKIFDKIFEDDTEFQNKYVNVDLLVETKPPNEWIDMQKTFLLKYYFDCFHEFKDPTIPDKFLWTEVGRLLDKDCDDCKEKFQELRSAHFDKLLQGGYIMNERVTLEIIMDNIIMKECLLELNNSKNIDNEDWDTDLLDMLVQFVYDNISMVKDAVCYFVCLATIAKKINVSFISCKRQWDNLTSVYKTILNDKKENPDVEIDWRYIETFDIIFDYGMDTNLLEGYEKNIEKQIQPSGKFGVKKINIKDIDKPENGTDSNEELNYDERGFTLRTKRKIGQEKAMKILEYYLKNKDKFTSPNNKKIKLWETLGNQIGMPASECAHRFRNLRQLYITYVQKEINKPEMPIIWPYYTLCKKVFGYRAIKAKLKNGKTDSSDSEDWSSQEIKKLINFVSKNINIQEKMENDEKWTEIARDLGRTEGSCYEKFLELRKSYRKLKTLKSNNPEAKVSWKYFNMMDEIFSKANLMEIENIKTELNDDEDYQYIIVMPEEDSTQEEKNIQTIDDTNTEKKKSIWNKRSKTRLLKLYLNYLQWHTNTNIYPKEMWSEIAKKMDKSPYSCRKMYLLLKQRYQNGESTLYNKLMEEILSLRPTLKVKTFKNVDLNEEKVEKALNFYLENIERVENTNKNSEIWSEIGNLISEPPTVVYNKINYLKRAFLNGKETPFNGILKEITDKDSLKVRNAGLNPDWSELDTERLLTWYLAHLDKFKNPKCTRSYLWMEASDILKKSPIDCSKKMQEIRTKYRTMIKENAGKLQEWRFYNLCQRIYGTGKKSSE